MLDPGLGTAMRQPSDVREQGRPWSEYAPPAWWPARPAAIDSKLKRKQDLSLQRGGGQTEHEEQSGEGEEADAERSRLALGPWMT